MASFLVFSLSVADLKKGVPGVDAARDLRVRAGVRARLADARAQARLPRGSTALDWAFGGVVGR